MLSLTDGLMINYEAADDAVVAAPGGEAVSCEDDVEGLWNNKHHNRSGFFSFLDKLETCLGESSVPQVDEELDSRFTQTLEGCTLRISVHDRFNIWRTRRHLNGCIIARGSRISTFKT